MDDGDGKHHGGDMMLRKKEKEEEEEEEEEGGCDIHNIHKNNERAGNCTRFFSSSLWSSTRERKATKLI
jgi:hypothetical protein